MKFSLMLCSGLLCACATTAVVAHPGHGHPEHQSGPMHYMTSPLHFGPLLLTAAALLTAISCVAIAVIARRRRTARKTQSGSRSR